MSSRVEPCIECPKCHIRYVIGSNLPIMYYNGSYIVVYSKRADVLRLYCTCDHVTVPHTFSLRELKRYVVSDWAVRRGYGSREEIVSARAASAS